MLQFALFLLGYALAFLAAGSIAALAIGYAYAKKLYQCESCLNIFPRRHLALVSTFRRGVMLVCAHCAIQDREMAQRELQSRGIKIAGLPEDWLASENINQDK